MLTNSFEKYKKIILQAFINYYGEENSKYIIDKLLDADIIWYDTEMTNSKNISSCINTNISEDKINNIIMSRKKDALLQSAYIDEFDVLVLPQKFNITYVIHEMNHKIGSHILSKVPFQVVNGVSYGVEKGNGVMLENDDMNEIINQMMTYDLIKELKKLGVDFDITPSWQEAGFPLVASFFEKYKDLLKKLYIDGNLKSSINEIGAEIFQEYTQFLFVKIFRLKSQIRKGETVCIPIEDINLSNEYVNRRGTHFKPIR